MERTTKMMFAVTGHRPEKLVTDLASLRSTVEKVLTRFSPEKTFVGMPAGVDLLVAEVCQANHLPYVAARPWAGHTPGKGDESVYAKILEGATEVVNVSPVYSYPGPEVYEKRNRYMVDNAAVLLSVWDGFKAGGTWRATSYAFRQHKPVIRVNPATCEVEQIGDIPIFLV